MRWKLVGIGVGGDAGKRTEVKEEKAGEKAQRELERWGKKQAD